MENSDEKTSDQAKRIKELGRKRFRRICGPDQLPDSYIELIEQILIQNQKPKPN